VEVCQKVAASITLAPRSTGWLRSTSFDLTFVVGIAIASLLTGLYVVLNPSTFTAIFIINGWLLGYHHVTSTYTRLVFDRDSIVENRFLLTWLPLIVLATVVVASIAFGAWILTTVYLYWQWWHYTRQSYGVSRIYARKANIAPDRLTTAAVYGVPLWGILYRSYQAPDTFIFSSLKVVPVPFWLVSIAGVCAVVITGAWLSRQIVRRSFATPLTLYICSHVTIFSFGYLLIDDITHGWLVLNVWHNAQYILTVWLFNNNRFRDGIHPKHRFLSYLSQQRNVMKYFAVCLIVSTIAYSLLGFALSTVSTFVATSLPLFAVAYQAINFHHYVVDAVIWKVRRRPVQQNFGITQ
jgi:hypothetical protein